jgi:ATP-dependent exoDNAse (exonuclease V) beta subunit
MKRPADWRQREAACNLHHSFIVQAPAGSGKTELLTQRMLALLALVENPEEVIAITFTRKAAAEMNNRLIRQLQDAAKSKLIAGEHQQLPAHEQVSRELALAALENDARHGWNLLEQPGRLRIRTIDSLCSELAHQLPVLSGLGGGQQIATDANALYRKAAVRTMAVIEDSDDELGQDVTRVLDRYDNQYDRLVDLLTGMLANREQWIGHLLNSRTGDGFNRQGLEEALRYLVEAQLKKAKEIAPPELLSALPRFYKFALSNQPDNETQLIELLHACGGVDCNFLDLPTAAEALPHWKTMLGSLLTAAGEMRKAAPGTRGGFPAPSSAKGEEKIRLAAWKNEFKALLEEHSGNVKLKEVLNTIGTLPSPGYEDEAWESLESLMRILLRAAENWGLVMAEAGELDFSEIASRAIQSLGFEDQPSDLALRMDYRIRHLLVDEFQDTSANQIRLLNRLTAGWSDGDGRTLCLVGDPMQSIYRFRKAEVSLFIKAWEGRLFDHIQLQPIQLSANFRSTKPVVDWVNKVFPVVMPRNNDLVTGAVSYSKASTKPCVPVNGTVDIQILPGRDDDEEARQVVDVIGQCDPKESIAILVRSRNHASTILAELDRLKQDQPRYRYQAIKFTPLAETTPILDLVSLTLALIQPADRLAWLATLRAPYIGLDLADLDTLVAGNSGCIILDALCANTNTSAYPSLSDDGQQRIHRAGPVLLQAVGRRGRQSVRSLVESTWISLGGPACVDNNSELDDAATYFDLLDSLEAENLPVDRDTLDLRMQELFAEPDADANGKLQVLTIHAAKGLQFDNVILPGLNRLSGGDDSKLLHWFELAGEEKIVMSPMRNNTEKEKQKKSGDLIKFIASVEKQRQDLEDGRLLYVAATRAIHGLFLFAAIKPTSKGEIKPGAGSLLSALWPAIQDDQAPLIEQAIAKLPMTETDRETNNPQTSLALPLDYRRFTARWKLPPPPESVQLANVGPAESHDYIEFSWAGEDARLTGNLVHRILQLIGEQGLDRWEKHGCVSEYDSWCRQQLASQGVKKDKADSIIARSARAIEMCLASERGRWILADHEDAHCELALTAVLETRTGPGTGPGQPAPRSMVLDRTFIDNDTRWIIDYKTSSHVGGDLEGFLKSETERYRQQLQLYRDAMAITETLPIRTALYFPLLDRFLVQPY